MDKINFQNGQRVNDAYVEIDQVRYTVTDAEYSGATPLSAQVLNTLQDNVEDAINNLQTLPSGGTQGQVLTKQSATEGDADWETIQTLPSGGTTGQVLTKQSSTDGDADWETIEGNEIAIGDEDTVTGKTKLWIEDDSIDSMFSEVVNSLEGNETTKAPSVKAVNDRFTYSTEEVRIGTWIGKPLYRKTIQISSLPNATIGYAYHNISNFNELTNISAIEKNSNNEFLPIPFIGANNSALHTQISVTDTQIIIRTATNKSESSAIVTLEYTKTTD